MDTHMYTNWYNSASLGSYCLFVMKDLVKKCIVLQIQTAPSRLQPASARCYLTLLPCWIFWYHCTTAMLGAQPLLPGVRESPGTSTLNDLRWSVARRVMSSKELLSALLCAVYPGIWSSSGINWRCLSGLLLKQLTLRSTLRVLNSCCPWMGRLAYCSCWMDAGAACLTAGTMHSRPRRGCHFAVIFGVSRLFALSGHDDFTIRESRACLTCYIVSTGRLGISKHRSSVQTTTQNMRL